jgi:DNA (cytosine-5)-methyltransferase 1
MMPRESKGLKYASVCSGIEAATVAWHPLNWEPVLFSEIEPFPIALLRHHYPQVPVHGDFTTLIDSPPMCDLLCGGTPCQAFSIAGLRESLADDRGNLTLQFVRLANAIDDLRSAHGLEPGWVLWENVPGVLSTNDNAFGAFLGGLCGRGAPIPEPEGGWTSAGVVDGPQRCAAWRVLDAQHFGLAQRRKRVFVLALGGAGRWAAADALLPIIQGSEWYPAPSRSTGEGATHPTAPSLTASGRGVSRTGDTRGQDPAIPISTEATIAPSMTTRTGTGTGNSGMDEYVVPVLVRMREGKEGGGKGPLVSEDKSLTLATANDQVLSFRITDFRTNTWKEDEVSMQVRRLTPVECERLQGFPDGYTDIPWRGKDHAPDGPRYKALGNSWAVLCARYIGERIEAVRRKEKPEGT